MQLEQLQPSAMIRGILPDAPVEVASVQWFGSEALELTYETPAGKVANQPLYRDDEASMDLVDQSHLGAATATARCSAGSRTKLEAARTGNGFLETNLVIVRLHKLARTEEVQQKLKAPDGRWDLAVCDEAHTMSARPRNGQSAARRASMSRGPSSTTPRSMNKPDDFILVTVESLEGDTHRVHDLRQPFRREPDFHAGSVNDDFAELLSRAEAPM